MNPNELPKLELAGAVLRRRYIVRDNKGRYGIATYDPSKEDVLFAHPLDVPAIIRDVIIAENMYGSLLTDTPFNRKDGRYRGVWYDYTGYSQIADDDVRTLEIVDDLGWIVSDQAMMKFAHPTANASPEDAIINIKQAMIYCREIGINITERGIRKLCKTGGIEAQKIGRDWAMTYRAINSYLDKRSKRVRKSKN
ncbi:hypothetical protein BECAL_02304 [Bellilinea caldifistulae]|uniref:Uncharacterized protein n=1 Tax=Bellilinea caldifistulae TaxID=360411 RepID=A0A0P6XG62_9CHLR|nr:hypothetical protein [Bellilinea caldifistulae]KPL73838.1 hypothetical protein AC812_13695 [Bellilinea caldifistulae]GAP11119.1 hypothetical protein BECAL_02304 [Bellilinea caldifistulae]